LNGSYNLLNQRPHIPAIPPQKSLNDAGQNHEKDKMEIERRGRQRFGNRILQGHPKAHSDHCPIGADFFVDPLGLFLAGAGIAAETEVAAGGIGSGAIATALGGVIAAGGVAVAGLALGNELADASGFSDWGGDWLANNVFAPQAQSAMPPPKPPGGGPPAAGACPNSPNGDNESNASGREAHKWWQPPEGYVKEFTFDNGMRADAINFDTQDIMELKPDNPEAIQQGQAQLQQYIQQAQAQFGGTWTGEHGLGKLSPTNGQDTSKRTSSRGNSGLGFYKKAGVLVQTCQGPNAGYRPSKIAVG
jgi:Restriction endonuclease fold toxin 9